MNLQTLEAVYGALLLPAGKLAFRSGLGSDESSAGAEVLRSSLKEDAWQRITEGVQCAHAPAGSQPLACLLCLAQEVSAASSCAQPEGQDGPTDSSQPLYSVFTHLNGEHPDLALPFRPYDGTLEIPGTQPPVTRADYAARLEHFRAGLGKLACTEDDLDALLALLAYDTANVPACIIKNEKSDISLYDFAKMTAAVSACLSEYLLDKGVTDMTEPYKQKAFRDEKAFLLYSADLSGIQKFIYTVATKGAQKSLRSRSFFLELMMEHYADTVLRACGLSRVNLIYSGGGHCYLLLPNTQKVQDAVRDVNTRTNDALIDWFGTALFAAHGFAACSMNDLTNTPAANTPYKIIFRKVSSAISRHKMSRYSPQQIRRLNRPQGGQNGRECTVCGSTDLLRENRCRWCAGFEDLSAKLQSDQLTAYVVTDNPQDPYDFPLPCDAYLTLTDEATANAMLKKGHVLRIYTKNRSCPSLPRSAQLDLCDYYASNQNTDLAQRASGIRRLAICRMDVDNLGHAFVAGFEKSTGKTPQDKFRYVTLSRTASLSRQLSHFFKRCMGTILSSGDEALQVSVIYSGGDDVFLIGAWDHVIHAAQRIQSSFTAFNGGALTLSGGIGLYDEKYPIRLAADETAALEAQAKQHPGKNAVTVFEPADRHTYSWAVFDKQVVGEKLTLLNRFFANQDERGMAFLYRMTDLLRQAETEKLNLARYAYLLARLQPRRNSLSYDNYADFSRKMYAWACNPQDRGQLVTAIYLYVYMNRKAD